MTGRPLLQSSARGKKGQNVRTISCSRKQETLCSDRNVSQAGRNEGWPRRLADSTWVGYGDGKGTEDDPVVKNLGSFTLKLQSTPLHSGLDALPSNWMNANDVILLWKHTSDGLGNTRCLRTLLILLSCEKGGKRPVGSWERSKAEAGTRPWGSGPKGQ